MCALYFIDINASSIAGWDTFFLELKKRILIWYNIFPISCLGEFSKTYIFLIKEPWKSLIYCSITDAIDKRHISYDAYISKKDLENG